MPETPVLFTVHDGHARITLNRPDRLNALTRDLMLRLSDSVQEAIARDDVRVISLTGSGRGFCAGQDLSERDPRKHEGPLDLAAIQRELFHPVVRALAATPKPVVACVNGIAAGAGAGLSGLHGTPAIRKSRNGSKNKRTSQNPLSHGTHTHIPVIGFSLRQVTNNLPPTPVNPSVF